MVEPGLGHASGRESAPLPLTADTYVAALTLGAYRPYACHAASASEFRNWQRTFRPRLRSLLGLDIIAARGPIDLQPQQLAEEDTGEYVREEWTVQSEPGFRLPFSVLRPRTISAPLPLVIAMQGHVTASRLVALGEWWFEEERAQIETEDADIARQAVREGYVVITPDLRGFGSLRRQEDVEAGRALSCRTMQMHALLFGRTLIGERVWDVMRLIDHATTRPDVDATRIAVTGQSGGGTVTVYAAACDERIGVAVPSASFCTFERSIAAIQHCECNYVPGLFAAAEMYDVAGLIAPRSFLAVTGREDPIFPYDGVQAAFDELQQMYALAGASDRCLLHAAEGGHRYYGAAVWPFIRAWLPGY